MDIKRFEAMAKFDLSEEESQLISGRVDSIIESFFALEGIDTTTTEPLVTVLDIRNVMREDIAKKTIAREELMSNAPEQNNGYFRVPKTIDEAAE